mgnify:CR=1 FL=1
MKEKKSNRGRKKLKIDWDRVDKSLIAGSNGVQVAAMLGVHPETLYDKCKEEKKVFFSDYMQQKKQEGNDILLSKQFELASEGDKMMLIWLGKNRLDQSDKKEIKQQNTGSLININMKGGQDKPIQSENDIED